MRAVLCSTSAMGEGRSRTRAALCSIMLLFQALVQEMLIDGCLLQQSMQLHGVEDRDEHRYSMKAVACKWVCHAVSLSTTLMLLLILD